MPGTQNKYNVNRFDSTSFCVVQVLYTHSMWDSIHCIQVYDLIHNTTEAACRGIRHMSYEGYLVCNRGFRILMGIGQGRFARMRAASRAGEKFPPFDARYIARGKKPPSEARSKVHGFLSKLYYETAEFIPDGLNSNKRPRQGDNRRDREMDRTKIKHLPPASIGDYHLQCVAALPEIKVSKKLFVSVSRPW